MQLRHHRQVDHLQHNRFERLAARPGELSPRSNEYLHQFSLGMLGARSGTGAFVLPVPSSVGFLPFAWATGGRGLGHHDRSWTREGLVDVACVRLMRGEPVEPGTRRLLGHALEVETSWARRLVVGMCAGSLFLQGGEVRQAAWASARVADAWRGFERLRRRLGIAEKPAMLRDYEAHCARVLAAFDPPVRSGATPVETLARLVRRLGRARPTRARVTIDALNALITAGQDASDPDIEQRVVAQLARMLRARVLVHRARGRTLHREDQAVHTLSTWTIRRLARDRRRVRAFRIPPRPEYWRPEQRRPGGVLAFPVGDGTACLARRRPFAANEVDAVRGVLRFLGARHGAGRPVATRPPAPRRAAAPESAIQGLVGTSRAWSAVLRQVWRVAPTGCGVLLRGETGTGKELVARAIHYNSTRAGMPFVPLNCAALGPETFLAELFGHARGAFTGAERSRPGLVRSAHRGTLFLDELGDMPPAMQVALLRVLQERRVRPVGSARTHPVDVRILSATNRDLEALIRRGDFREDLYHRLNVLEIGLPPLRERLDDLPALAAHLLARMERPKALTMETVEVLAAHTWPGNVRELENVLQAAALLSDGGTVAPEVVRRLLVGRRTAATPPSTRRRLAPRAARLLARLGRSWWSAPALAAELEVSTRTVNRELRDLLDAGLVERFGEARASRYRRVGAAWRDSSAWGAG